MTTDSPPSAEPPPAGDSAGHEGAAFDWEGRRADAGLGRLVWLLPLGLAIDILLSLWVSYRHVTHSVIAQVEPLWVPGERLAARGQLIDHDRDGVDRTQLSLTLVDADNKRWPLAELAAIPKGGLNQGAFEVPAQAAIGAGQVEFHFVATLPSGKSVDLVESIEIGLVASREPHEPVHTINASILQWADDTSPQPEGMRIDVQPFGRLLAGFDNDFIVRVTDPKGAPMRTPIEVRLLSGELGGATGPGVAKVDDKSAEAPLVHRGETDALGLASFRARLDSDVLRLEVRVEPPAAAATEATPSPAAEGAPALTAEGAPAPAAEGAPAPDTPVAKPPARRFRLVSYSGGVRLEGRPRIVAPGAVAKVEGASLQPKRPIYVDVHGPNGAWIDTFMPPLQPYAAPREWTTPASLTEGLLHFEGYAYTNAPGQSAEVHRVVVSPPGKGPLDVLLAAQRARLDLPRDKTGFDPALERAYFDHLEAHATGDALRASATGWLLGTLPVEVYGPPLATTTRGREEAELHAWKQRWTMGLRWFLWGGGALAILFATHRLMRQQRRVVVATREVLGDADASLTLTARGDLLTRGIVVIVLLSSALALTAFMLESLVWKL